jgi:hypothetical protein
MPTKPEPPKTGIALLDSVLGDAARTRRAVCLLLTAALALAVVSVPVLVLLYLGGTAGAAAVGGAGALTTAGIAARKLSRRGRPPSQG